MTRFGRSMRAVILGMALAVVVPAGAPGVSMAQDASVAPLPTPGFELLSPGADPRVELRYAPAAGSTATITMETATDQTLSVAGGAPIATSNTTLMTWSAAVTEVGADGTTHTELSLDDVELVAFEGLDDATEAVTRTQLEGMIGLTGWTETDATGKIVDSGVELPDGLDPILATVFESTMSSFSLVPQVFPTEPVGVGASWSSVTRMPATAVMTPSAAQTMTTITALDGETVTTQVTATVSNEPGLVAFPGLPADAEVRIMAAQGSSSGTSTMDPTSLRMQTTVRSSSTSELAIQTGGQTVQMSIVTNVTATMIAE